MTARPQTFLLLDDCETSDLLWPSLTSKILILDPMVPRSPCEMNHVVPTEKALSLYGRCPSLRSPHWLNVEHTYSVFPRSASVLHYSSLGTFAKHIHVIKPFTQHIKVSNSPGEVYQKENTENPCPGLAAPLKELINLGLGLSQATGMVFVGSVGLGLAPCPPS